MTTVQVRRDGPVAVIRMDRPEAHNALDPEMLALLVEAVRERTADDTVRAVVLTGGPTAFTTGADLIAAARPDPVAAERQAALFQDLATALRFARQPVIAAIGGFAYGVGLEIAVNCDARIAADNARFACPEVAWSLTLSSGSSVLLRQLIGEGWTRELLLFGTVLDATSALRIGLVTRVVPVYDLERRAVAMAHQAASYSAGALRRTKELLNADPRPWQETLDAEAAAVLEGVGNDELRQRVRGFTQRKRGPAPDA